MVKNSVNTAAPRDNARSQRLCGLIAIETSGSAASVAWRHGEQTEQLIHLDPKRRTAATLTAAIGELLVTARQQSRSVDVIAVANGPGSFTGLRIGVTAAKMLAYALNCRLVAVDTLAAMAGAVWRAQPQCEAACVAINAYRGQLFVAHWSRADWLAAAQEDRLADASQVCSAADWHAALAKPRLGASLAAEPSVARASDGLRAAGTAAILSLRPTAEDVAVLGRRLADGGHFVSPLELKPNYLRDSAAEEKLR